MQTQETGIRSEINVTPLVDVVLVLLIIFMVVTPMLGSQHVQLPYTKNPEQKPDFTNTRTIVRKFNGELLFDQKVVSPAELQGILNALHDSSSRNFHAAASGSKTGLWDGFSVLEMISVSGFRNILLMSQPAIPGEQR